MESPCSIRIPLALLLTAAASCGMPAFRDAGLSLGLVNLPSADASLSEFSPSSADEWDIDGTLGMTIGVIGRYSETGTVSAMLRTQPFEWTDSLGDSGDGSLTEITVGMRYYSMSIDQRPIFNAFSSVDLSLITDLSFDGVASGSGGGMGVGGGLAYWQNESVSWEIQARYFFGFTSGVVDSIAIGGLQFDFGVTWWLGPFAVEPPPTAPPGEEVIAL